MVKKIKIATLFLSLSVLLTANGVLAKDTASSTKSHESDIKKTMLRFIGLGVGSVVLQKGANALDCDATSKAVLQLSNVLVQGGMIFGKPALTDLGFRALLASGSASVANMPLVAENLQSLPLVGQYLKAAGPKGVAITTVAFYELVKSGYIHVVDGLPPSMQHLVRGE